MIENSNKLTNLLHEYPQQQSDEKGSGTKENKLFRITLHNNDKQ